MKYILKLFLLTIVLVVLTQTGVSLGKASAATICGTYYIDSNDPNWVDSYDDGATGWSYKLNQGSSFRYDHFISYNSSQTTERWFDWGSWNENTKICDGTYRVYVYLYNIAFVDPNAEYYSSYSGFGQSRFATINQETAPAGWSTIGYVTSGPIPITVYSSGQDGATGADGIRISSYTDFN